MWIRLVSVLHLFLWTILCEGSSLLVKPISFDLQIQLPTTSNYDPLIPAFIGHAKIDFILSRPVYSSNKYLKFANSSHGGRQHHLRPYNQLRQEGASIAFDSVNLTNFENVTLEGENHHIKAVKVKTLKEKVLFVFDDSALPPGRYILKIERYSGIITYEDGIFYREAGDNPVLATDFFPRHARTVFPCVDDIAAKAQFKLSLIHPRHTVAIASASPLESSSDLNANWKITKFVQTPSIAPYMLAFVILPIEFAQITTRSKVPINIFSNRLTSSADASFELANLTGLVYDEVAQILADHLPLTQLNVLLTSEAKTSRSFGLFTVNYDELHKADRTNKMYIIAKEIIRQWFGGIVSVSTWQDFCIQDDIVEYVAMKVVKAMEEDRDSFEHLRLAAYIKTHLAETFFAPGESVSIVDPSRAQILSRCGMKGSIALESLETVIGERAVLAAIRQLISSTKHRSFQLQDFTRLFAGTKTDRNVDLALVLDFWERNGGQPHLSVSKNGSRITLRQLNVGRQAKNSTDSWINMPLWPLRIEVENVSLPFTFMISQALDMAPINASILPLTNLDYRNHYRVNYDVQIWDAILQKMASPDLSVFSPRMKAQLVNDFCYFKSLNLIDKTKAEDLRQGFLQIMRTHVDQFPLCEFYSFWCVGGHQKRISLKKERKELIMDNIEKTNVVPLSVEMATRSGYGAFLCLLAFSFLSYVRCAQANDHRGLAELYSYVNSHSGPFRDHYATTWSPSSHPEALGGYSLLDTFGLIAVQPDLADSGDIKDCSCLQGIVQLFDQQVGIGATPQNPGLFGRLDHKLARNGEEANMLFQKYERTSEKLYCVSKPGECGATVPLYQWYVATEVDTIYTTRDVSDAVMNNMSPQGVLCYIWPNVYAKDEKNCSQRMNQQLSIDSSGYGYGYNTEITEGEHMKNCDVNKLNTAHGQWAMTKAEATPGTVAVLNCESGFVSSVSPTVVVCQRSGEWMPKTGKCRMAGCEGPLNWKAEFGDITFSMEKLRNPTDDSELNIYPIGTTAMLVCDKTSDVIEREADIVYCSDSGWAPRALGRCYKVCPEFNVSRGHVEYSNSDGIGRLTNSNGTVATLICGSGTKLSGAGTAVCTAGEWDTKDIGKCESVGCSPLKDVANGTIEYATESGELIAEKSSFYDSGTRAHLVCEKGTRVNGGHEAVCQCNEKWKPDVGTCA